MIKTAEDIKQDIRNLLLNSELAQSINGGIYYGYGDDDDRPKDSTKEDIVIIFTEGTTGEIQKGTITLVIYVPDIDMTGDGTMRPDGQRINELSRLAEDWRESLTVPRTSYCFPAQQPTILSMAEPNVDQHFISVKLKFKYYNND
jgi:hypothetical protein